MPLQTLDSVRGRTKRDIGVPNGLLNELNFWVLTRLEQGEDLRKLVSEKRQTEETSIVSQWNRHGRRLLIETTESLSRADLSWVYHPRYGFSGKESESKGLAFSSNRFLRR